MVENNILVLKGTLAIDPGRSKNNSSTPDKDLIYKSILFLYKYPQIIGFEYKVLKDTFIDMLVRVDLMKEKEMIRKYYKVAELNLSSGR